jgi:hypothetical protein
VAKFGRPNEVELDACREGAPELNKGV